MIMKLEEHDGTDRFFTKGKNHLLNSSPPRNGNSASVVGADSDDLVVRAQRANIAVQRRRRQNPAERG